MARASTTVDGIVYLLVSEPRRADYVARYMGSEMIECFSAEELETLTTEGKLNRMSGGKMVCQFTDMVFAARALAARQ